MSQIADVHEGCLFAWNGLTANVGRARTTPHASHAIAIGFALDKPVAVRLDGSSWIASESVAFPANHEHEANLTEQPVFAIHVDPLVFGMSLPRVTLPPRALVAEIVDVHRGDWNEARASYSASRVLQWLRTVASPLRIDRRVRRLAEILDADAAAEARPTLGDASSAIRLSADRASRLFREQLGISVPGFRLWGQLRRAVAELTTGATVTEAALASGFADGAHISRVSRRFFGVTPRTARLWRPRMGAPTTFGF